MKKSVLISGIVGAVVLYLINFLFYGMSGLMDSYAVNPETSAGRPDDQILHLHLALGHLVMGIFIAYIYRKWARGTHNFMHGIQFGALLGVAFGLGINLIWYATANYMTFTGHIIDSVWQIVSLGITGGVISVITGKTDDDE